MIPAGKDEIIWAKIASNEKWEAIQFLDNPSHLRNVQ